MKMPRIVLSGTSSRAGKTVVSIGLMQALRKRGYKIQPFKIGPDFIDPSFHLFATGRHSRNLDSFMMGERDIRQSFQRNAEGADIAVIEGTMGLYDSHDALEEKGSTAEVSKMLKTPVILIASVERISRTAAAFVLGYKLFDKNVDIKAVILNRVGSKRHAEKARVAVEKLAGMKVVGTMPRNSEIEVPERHLGLVPAYESEKTKLDFARLARLIEEYVDVDKIIKIAKGAPALKNVAPNPIYSPKNKYNVRLGIFRDKAFSFYYQDTIDAFAANGAKITYIDSMKDKHLPRVDALYIGGGFPEVFSEYLEANASLRKEVYNFCDSGKPVYGECGGLMYLGEKVITKDGEYEMVGFLPIETKMEEKFQALGYVIHRAIKDNPISRRGDVLLGHEFHNSSVRLLGEVEYVCETKRGKGIDGKREGILKNNTLAGYMHLHVFSYPRMIENFLGTASKLKL
ncbi:MAG: cobyrinate a,c-diamide synthase [Candidatus Hydrothermarchaeaceae archaeon]